MPARKKTGELPKPVIVRGQLGGLPLTPLTLSALADGHFDFLLGFRDDEETVLLKKRASLQLQAGGKRQSVPIEGRFFNGYSDALYRGLLPEVVLAVPPSHRLDDFLKDFVEYLGSVLSLGFFLPKKYLVRRDPVEDFIPCTIIAGPGLLFSRFITGLMHALQDLTREHPVLDEAMRIKLLGRFVRGFSGSDQLDAFGEVATTGRVLPHTPMPGHIRLAGGSRHTQDTLQMVLATHGLKATFESHTRNPVERLEFENALWRISRVVLPALHQRQGLSAIEAKQLGAEVERGILTIGQKRLAFEAGESLDASPQTSTKTARTAGPLRLDDAEILTELVEYATALGLTEEQQLFSRLANQLSDAAR